MPQRTFLDIIAAPLGEFLKPRFPRLFYGLASLYNPFKVFFFARKYLVKNKEGPLIILVAGEDGPDKLSTCQAIYDLYPVLAEQFRVKLLVPAFFRARHVRRLARLKPDLVLLSFDSGHFQELLEKAGVPLMGSDSEVCRTCYDKWKAREAVRRLGVAVAEGSVVDKGEAADGVAEALGYPLVVKPRRGGSSQGLSCIGEPKELNTALKRAFRWDREALLERYLPGREFTCTVYGNENPLTLPLGRKIMRFEREEMAARGETVRRNRFPVEGLEPFIEEICSLSCKIYRELGCRDMVRIDWKYIDRERTPYFLEINTLPWIGRAGGNIEDCAEAAGSSYEEFIMNLFRDSLRRNSSQNKRSGIVRS